MSHVILVESTPSPPPLKFSYYSYAPLALLAVAAPLVAEGYQVKIIDQRINPHWHEELLGAIDEETFCVGITSMTGRQLLHALEASRLVKERTSIPVVWGGVHASLLPDQTLRNPWIDFVVQGEGEETFLELLRAFDEKKKNFAIEGLWYKDNGNIRANPPRDFVTMDRLPRIPFDLVNLKAYDVTDAFPMFTSRGCAFRCGFCYNLRYSGRRWRPMSVERVVEDLKFYTEHYNPKKIIFRDDNFFQDLERARQIWEGILQEGFNFRWVANCRIDSIKRMADRDLMLLKESGFEGFGFGIESGSPKVLEIMQKDITVEDILAATRRLHEKGIIYYGSFVGGYPGETEMELEETMDLIATLFTQDPSFTFELFSYIPYPGTTAQDVLAKHGFHFPEKIEEWANFHFAHDSAVAPMGKARSLYAESTPWLTAAHKRKLFQVESLSQVAGRPLYRSSSPLARLLAVPYNMLIHIARLRWRHKLLGPVPEETCINLIRDIGLFLYRKVRGELPKR
jgi:radical SAM superfamily enzyme YgiQ (UPF0313 family)